MNLRRARTTSSLGTINFNVFTESDAEDMTRLLADVFTHRDPPATAVGLEVPEFEAFVDLLCPKAAAEGLTIVARSVDSGEMVGALLTEDSASESAEGMEHLSAKFDPIFDILGQLDTEYRGGRPVREGESMHLFLLGVAAEFTGQGIAQELIARCLSRGAYKNYQRAVTEATNRTSQHVFRKQGFIERVRRSYLDHRFNGKAPFTSIADHFGPILMDRRLVP
jgi:ribosomal protein S18 acetylase RimI-like enzyme